MTTSNTQSKWALIGVRVCAVYLLLWTIAGLGAIVITISNGIFNWLQLVIIPGGILFGLTAFRLWQRRPWARGGAAEIFLVQAALGLIGLINPPNWNLTTSWIIAGTLVINGIIGWIFLTRPAVKALFQNQQSTINNQKSPNA